MCQGIEVPPIPKPQIKVGQFIPWINHKGLPGRGSIRHTPHLEARLAITVNLRTFPRTPGIHHDPIGERFPTEERANQTLWYTLL
jgi:hypothetical protein